METPEIAATPTTEDMRKMIREELNAILPGMLEGFPRAKDIEDIKTLLQQAATKSDVTNLQGEVDAQRRDMSIQAKEIAKHAQDIAGHQQRITEGERKFDAFSNEINRGIGEIKTSVTNAMAQMLEMSRQAFERNKATEERLLEVEKINTQQSTRIAGNANDIDDLRQRFTELFNPVRAMVVGDQTRPPLNNILTSIQSDIAIGNTRMQRLEEIESARQKRNAAMWAFIKSRPGAVLVSLAATSFVGLFSKVDFAGVAHFIQLVFGGK